MSTLHYTLLVTCVVGLSIGQILFKKAAITGQDGSAGFSWLALIFNPYFIAAVVLYAGLTFFWVWLLVRIPLVVAYPFYALAFAVTPVLAYWVFGETVSSTYIIGVALIMVGLVLTAL